MSSPTKEKITVYYDGSCPTCVRDRKHFETLCKPQRAEQIDWFDITNKEKELVQLGIDPDKAMKELHIRINDEQILSEMDAYIVLMKQTFWLKPLAWFLEISIIKLSVAKIYHRCVHRRLRRTGRL